MSTAAITPSVIAQHPDWPPERIYAPISPSPSPKSYDRLPDHFDLAQGVITVPDSFESDAVDQEPASDPMPTYFGEDPIPTLQGNYEFYFKTWPPSEYTSEFVVEVLREKHWNPIEPRPIPDPSLAGAVGRREIPCPVCADTDVWEPACRGEVTGLVVRRPFLCDCARLKQVWRVWGNIDIVPLRFRDVALSTLGPSRKSMLEPQRQIEIITTLKENPDDSFFLWGPPGTGKTHCLVGLLSQSVWRWWEAAKLHDPVAVWRVRTNTLLEQHSLWASRSFRDDEPETTRPAVSVSDIRSAVKHGLRPCLFLDEIDKISATPTKLNKLFEIVDAIWEHQGQVVATSNKSPEALLAQPGWDPDKIGPVIRRIGRGEGAHTIFFG